MIVWCLIENVTPYQAHYAALIFYILASTRIFAETLKVMLTSSWEGQDIITMQPREGDIILRGGDESRLK